jgi:hypothetical protein
MSKTDNYFQLQNSTATVKLSLPAAPALPEARLRRITLRKVCTSTQTNQVSSYGTCQVVITFFILFDTKITHQTLTKSVNNLKDLSPSIA